jgi:hypothetical protein
MLKWCTRLGLCGKKIGKSKVARQEERGGKKDHMKIIIGKVEVRETVLILLCEIVTPLCSLLTDLSTSSQTALSCELTPGKSTSELKFSLVRVRRQRNSRAENSNSRMQQAEELPPIKYP